MAAGTALRQRLRDWALRRQGNDALPLRLTARRIYILPTPAGWTFAALVGVMFLAGMNYGNGLALLFTFWLAGFGLVAAVQTQRSLNGTSITAANAAPAHAGDAVMVRLGVSGSVSPEDLQLAADDAATSTTAAPDSTATAATTTTGELVLPVGVRRRGRWRAPPLLLSSTAPFGLFRTWTWLTLDIATLVYPRAAGDLPVPESAGDDDGDATRTQGQDDLAWLREFREGDSPRQVAWKAYARGAPLLVREYHGQGAAQRQFDFAALGAMGTEAKLSQLARWIVAADERGEGWILRMPGSSPLAGRGAAHRAQCLERLALYGLPEIRR